ncbi:MAG: NADH-quinone oxidoreductase subunit L [Armatimonadetes bacterium]|nr:NADH-quinone oxidoreductase subunit L [Armatimonadota bacterium]
MIWIALGLPVLGALLQTFLGPGLQGTAGGKRILGILAVVPIVLSFLIGAKIVMGMDPSAATVVASVPWIDIKGLTIPFELRIDTLSMTMVLIITGIGSLIHIYATGYMSEEKDYGRFFAYLNLFIASMLMLVLGNNLLLLFVGWEGVGLCSYLLIGFWYEDLANSRAANKAFIVNRIGDWGLTLGLLLIVATVATASNQHHLTDTRYLSYDTIFPILRDALTHNVPLATTIGLLLFVGACGKSAQFPLYLWLPDAMAGPTPVSALIHAATMVTSGVVLLNRMHLVYEISTIASMVVCLVGAFTAIFAAIIACGQTDIKKVLAFSTVSQLGYMFIGCGVGASWAGMFHVTTHAFFKALLFLGAGAVIHAMAHDQDMRNYGNLKKYLPFTFVTMTIAWLAIAGVPLLSGSYSKEEILGAAFENAAATRYGFNAGQYAGYIGLAAALLTAFYMTRLMMLTFFGKERWMATPEGHEVAAIEEGESHEEIPADEGHEHEEGEDHHHGLTPSHRPHEVPISMWLPLVILAMLSAGGGWYLSQDERFKNWLAVPTASALDTHEGASYLQQIAIGVAIGGIVLGIFLYYRGLPKAKAKEFFLFRMVRGWVGSQFGYDQAMTTMSVEGGSEIATMLDDGVDERLIGGSGVGIGRLTEFVAGVVRVFQTGIVRMYALSMLVGVVGLALIVIYFFKGGHP